MENGITKAIRLTGDQTALGVMAGVTPQAVQKWFAQGWVPSKRCLKLEELLKGAVTRYELNPQVFGDPPVPSPQAAHPRAATLIYRNRSTSHSPASRNTRSNPMTKHNITGRADILHKLMDSARTEIIRVRVSPKQKAKFAAHSASLGTRSATLAYELVIAEMTGADVAPQPPRRREAERRPLTLSKQPPRMCPGWRSGRGGVLTRRILD